MPVNVRPMRPVQPVTPVGATIGAGHRGAGTPASRASDTPRMRFEARQAARVAAKSAVMGMHHEVDSIIAKAEVYAAHRGSGKGK